MYYLVDLIDRAFFDAGQSYLRLEDLDIAVDTVEKNVLNPVAMKYNRTNPASELWRTHISQSGTKLPKDCNKPIALYLNFGLNTYLFTDPVPETSWRYLGGQIFAPSGSYVLKYSKNRRITKQVDKLMFEDITADENVINLKTKVVGLSLMIEGVSSDTKEEFRILQYENKEDLYFEGDFDNKIGTYSEEDKTITFDNFISDVMFVSYKSDTAVIYDITEDDITFFMRFNIKLMENIASYKTLMEIEGSSVSVNRDRLLEYIRERKKDLEEELNAHKHWWEFGR